MTWLNPNPNPHEPGRAIMSMSWYAYDGCHEIKFPYGMVVMEHTILAMEDSKTMWPCQASMMEIWFLKNIRKCNQHMSYIMNLYTIYYHLIPKQFIQLQICTTVWRLFTPIYYERDLSYIAETVLLWWLWSTDSTIVKSFQMVVYWPHQVEWNQFFLQTVLNYWRKI